MFVINEDLSIYITRGDVGVFQVSAVNKEDGTPYMFQPGDVVQFKVTEKKACENVMSYVDVVVEQEVDIIEFILTPDKTKIGEVISKPTDYWYEVELNPYTHPETIIGYDEETGPKIFKLLPEGDDIKEVPIEPEDIPIVDEELSLTSKRPVANYVIAKICIEQLRAMEDAKTNLSNRMQAYEQRLDEYEAPDLSSCATKEELKAHVGTMFTFLLTAGTEVYRLEDEVIKEDTMVDVYTDVYGVCPVDVKTGVGYLEFTFEPQEKDVNVKVRCF